MLCTLTRLLDASRKLLTGRPLLLSTLVAILAISAIFTASVAAWMSYDLTAGLPKRDAINGLGDMAQSTTIFDASDRPAFTIFKEQRIEVPLEKMSPNLIKAVISVEDQRFYRAQRRRRHPHRRRRGSQPAKRAARRRRQHHHAAARAPELPDPRQDLPPQAEGSHPRQLHRERVLEERDPRDVPEQGLLRRRALRRRSRGARLLRQERHAI